MCKLKLDVGVTQFLKIFKYDRFWRGGVYRPQTANFVVLLIADLKLSGKGPRVKSAFCETLCLPDNNNIGSQ